MKITFNKRTINIPDNEIKSAVDNLGLTTKEAVEMWLEDNGYRTNAEQEELDKTAKKVKVDRQAREEKPEKKDKKSRTVVISDEKQALFAEILENLKEYTEDVEVITNNKLIRVKIGEKTFDIDVIEKRKPKK